MSTLWSKRNNMGGLAPCTIFSTTQLSPRQIANKAYSLGCKKLDRDDKRSKQRYHVRERLLLFNTITKADEVLNSRTRRTNRRVMAAEDEEEDSSDEFTMKHQQHHHHHHNESHSPLRSRCSEEEEEEEEEEEIETIKKDQINSLDDTKHNTLLPRDCRIAITHSSRVITSPIAAII